MTITLEIPAAEVTTAPTANTLKFNGAAQELVTAGTATNGTMQYALGESDTTAPAENWGTSVPTGTGAGDYYVWYRAYSTHGSTDAVCVPVTIAADTRAMVITLNIKDRATVATAPTGKTLTYTGTVQELVTAGTGVEGGTLKYKLGESGLYSTSIPTAAEAGTYTVYYKVFADSDHSDNVEASVTATITGASITYSDGSVVTAPKFGETLQTTIAPPAAAGTTYQWHRGDSAGLTPADANKIDGATAATHEIVLDDIDCYLKVVVTPPEGGAYTISLAPKVQKADGPAAPATLAATATANSITVTAPASGGGKTYEYRLDSGEWQTATTFSGLTEDTAYTLYAREKVSAGYNEGAEKSATVNTLRTPITAVSIVGTAQIGATLTASYEPANASGVSYQWYRGDSADFTPAEGDKISGATGRTYTLSGAVNVNKYIKVVATQSNPNGDDVVLTSAAAGPVLKAGAEQIVISEARNIEKTSTTIKVRGLPAADSKYMYYLLPVSGNELPTNVSGFSGGTTQDGTVTFTELTANTAYYVAVKFKGDETTDEGQMTNVLTVMTSSKAPSTATVTPSVSNFTYSESVTATKTGDGDATLYYGKSSNVKLGTWTDNSTSATLNVGIYYIWAEIAETSDTAAYKSAATQFKVTPTAYDTPASVTATPNSAAGTVTVSVTQGTTHGTQLEYAVVSGSVTSYTGSYTPMSGTSATLNGLTSGNAYTVFVRERGSANGNYSASSAAYKQFTATFDAFTVTYNANGGTGAPATQTVVAPVASTTVAQPGTMSRTGYTFSGWNTAANGSGTPYSAGAAISNAATLYAQWTPVVYTVTFADTSKTGGSAPSAVTKAYDDEWTIPAGTLTRTSYNFAGWTSVSGSTAVEYTTGQTVKNLGTVTLYPVWVAASYTVTGNVTSISNSPVTLTLKKGDATLKTYTTEALTAGGNGFTATSNFDGVPAGVYNLVAEQTINGIPVTKTVIVTLTDSNKAAAISITSGTANSAVEVKDDTPAAVVGNLDAEAETHAQDDQKVQYIMTLERQEPQELAAGTTNEQQEVQEAIAGIQELDAVKDNETLKDSLEYIDVTVNKETTDISNVGTPSEEANTATERIRETTNVVQIGIPYNPLAWTKAYGVYLFYSHNGTPKPMTRGSTAAGGFVVDAALGMIFIYSNEFSTYALGYDDGATQEDTPPTPPSNPVSSGSGTGDTITVPVSGESASVSVSASVSGTTATVKAPTAAELDKVIGAGVETGEVEIDVSGLNKDITTVNIPTDTVKAIEKAVSDPNNDASALTVKLTDGAISFDAEALKAIVEQAKGSDIRFNLDCVTKSKLNTAQKTATSDMDVQAVYDVYMTSNNVRISDFNGGKATVSVNYTLKDGQLARGVTVYYVADDGTVTRMPVSYADGMVSWTVEHFSNYVIAYEETCPQDATCPISAFTDADPTAWYHDGVHWALENGVMSGVGGNRFDPNGDTSRAMVATMLWRLEDSPVVNYGMRFEDVEADAWYTEAIRWANSTGIITGYGDTAFGPSDPVTREQLASMLYRYAQYKGIDVSVGEDTNILSYGDAFDVSGWANAAMQWAVGAGIITGYDEGGQRILAPQRTSNRAVVATMFQRFCEGSKTTS